ncbi:hypothetical protein [Tepidiforma sp.]|uniref:hypothetical protein n=1 Tax=Tepidiforma sp. TaxID=2682230 RepID=UPI002ADE295E|nr:hypothetical protein [Tepidiforma sp.]
MGRRKERKRERRAQRREWLTSGRDPFEVGDPFEELPVTAVSPPAAQRVCGQCREFVEDREFGRGTCLHPGSGVMHPWTDTPGCDFWARGRR